MPKPKEDFRVTCNVTGLQAVEDRFNRLSLSNMERVIDAATSAAARPVLVGARQNAPVRTGALQLSIQPMPLEAKGKSNLRGVVVGVGKKWFQGDQFYGAFQEWGWRAGPRKGSRRAKALRSEATNLRHQRKVAGRTLTADQKTTLKQQEARLRGLAKKARREDPSERPQIPGEHYIEYAFQEHAQQSLGIMLNTLTRLTGELLAQQGTPDTQKIA